MELLASNEALFPFLELATVHTLPNEDRWDVSMSAPLFIDEVARPNSLGEIRHRIVDALFTTVNHLVDDGGCGHTDDPEGGVDGTQVVSFDLLITAGHPGIPPFQAWRVIDGGM